MTRISPKLMPVVAASLLAASACGRETDVASGPPPEDQVRFCAVEKDGETVRVPEAECETADASRSSGHHIGMSPFFWYFIGTQMAGGGRFFNSPAPGYGETLDRNGTRAAPAGSAYYKAPAPGATLSPGAAKVTTARGGFGGTAGVHSSST